VWFSPYGGLKTYQVIKQGLKMEDKSTEDFPGEKYYNKTTLAIYFIFIGLLLLDKEPTIGVFKLVVGTGFTVLWTYIAGLAIYFTIKPLIAVFFDKSKLDSVTTDYVAWIVPGIGFCLFITMIYK
jgi:hypothetical protein